MNYRRSRIVLLVLVVVAGFGAGRLLSVGRDISKGAEPGREITAVFDGAAFLPMISPIGLASVFGEFANGTTESLSIPLSLAFSGLSIKFDGKPAALLGVYDGPFDQANVQVPVDLDVSDGMVEVEIEWENSPGKGGSSFEVPAALASPGIFEFPIGSGLAIVTNFSLGNDDVITGSFAQAPGTLPDLPGIVTQEAAPGGVITVWSAGLGPVNQPVETGNVPPTLPPPDFTSPTKTIRLFIGGEEATVLGSALHPSFVGLYQINALVPNIEPTIAADVIIRVICDDGTEINSKADTTIAIRAAPAKTAAGD